MSRAYRVSIRGSVERVVHLEDGVSSRLELLPILSRERMASLLGESLGRRGFVVVAGRARREEGDGVVTEVALETGEVTVHVARDAEIALSRERTAAVYEERLDEERAALEARLAAELDREAEGAAEEARVEITAALERRLRDLAPELDRAIAEVSAVALEEKARSLGEVEEIRRDDATGEVTIKVRL